MNYGQFISRGRQVWGGEEERARLDRQAAWLAKVTGQEIVRRGRFWT